MLLLLCSLFHLSNQYYFRIYLSITIWFPSSRWLAHVNEVIKLQNCKVPFTVRYFQKFSSAFVLFLLEFQIILCLGFDVWADCIPELQPCDLVLIILENSWKLLFPFLHLNLGTTRQAICVKLIPRKNCLLVLLQELRWARGGGDCQ